MHGCMSYEQTLKIDRDIERCGRDSRTSFKKVRIVVYIVNKRLAKRCSPYARL